MGNQPFKVLLVYNRRSDRDLIVEFLGHTFGDQIDLRWAATFKHARDALANDRFDACLVDYQLGPHSGMELIEQSIAAGRRCPFILLTGHGNREVDIETSRAGVAGYISKEDLTAETLERAIRYAVEGLRYRAEHQRRAIFGVLEQLSAGRPLRLDGESAGSLKHADRGLFDNLVDCYGELLDLALENRAYEVDHDVSEGLEAMAQQLGACFATPRDVIDIHYTSTRRKTAEAVNERATPYIEEGNLMALELMGHLAAYYRGFVRPDHHSHWQRRRLSAPAGEGRL